MVLKDEIYSRVLASLRSMRHELPDLYRDFAGPEAFVDLLRVANHMAFEERYEGRHPGDFSEALHLEPLDPKAEPYRTEHDDSQIELFKALTSIDYQCIDSTIYREDPISGMVAKILAALSSTIVCNRVPEYNACRVWA